MSGHPLARVALLASVLVGAVACSTDAATGSGGGSTTIESATNGGSAVTAATGADDGADDPVPVVDPASVEAFCALDEQLDQLTREQLGGDDDAEVFREDMATFVRDNAAVIDQYLAAAPPEIRDDLSTTLDETRAAAADAELFGELLAGTGDISASNRVSAFIEVNCPP